MIVQESTNIEATPERIFSFMNEVSNRPDYIPMLEEIILLDEPPIRLGSRYTEIATIAGRKLETTYQVIGFEKDRQIRVKTLKSVFPIEVDLNLEEQEQSTLVNIRLDFTLSGAFRLAKPFIKGIVQQQAKDILNRMKELIEQRA